MDGNDNDDKDKSVIDKLMEVVTTGVSGMAKAALTTAQKLMGSCWLATRRLSQKPFPHRRQRLRVRSAPLRPTAPISG